VDPIRTLLADVGEPVLRLVIRLAGDPAYGLAMLGQTDD
jgi:hypothetical protein